MKKSIFIGAAVLALALTSCKKTETEDLETTDADVTAMAADTTMVMDSLPSGNADSINTTVVAPATGTGVNPSAQDSAK